MIRKSDLTLTPCEHLSVAVTLADGSGRRTVARLTEGDGCVDIELAAMPPEQAGVTAMHLESLTHALRARIRGVDGGMPGLVFDRRYRPVATARQVLAVAEQLAAIIACLDDGGRADPAEAFDRLDDDARRTLAAMARQVLAAAREADV